MITYSLLDKYNEIAYFCTTRHGGASVGNYASFNMSPFSGDNSVHLEENHQILCRKLDISAEKLLIPYQTHGTEIRLIDQAFFQLSVDKKTQYLSGVDALITSIPGICIGVTTADCVPLIFFDSCKKVVAVAHAGWRGTCARIAKKTVLTMNENFGCNPTDIVVSIGPSISAEVYEVGNEVVDSFKNAGFNTEVIFNKRNGSVYLDLWEANRQSLLKAGILPEHIEIAGICTFTEHERFFSARRLGLKSGRMLSGIMIK
ncbi:MAG: peptidoglycan editing factor PgeF [Paludibacter sp.]